MIASFGASVRSNLLVQRDLNDIINDIKCSPELQALVAALRSLPTDEQRRPYKAQYLPYFNCGTFRDNVRSDANLIQTQHLIVDVDGQTTDQVLELKHKLRADGGVRCAFISPSGTGVKIIYELNAEISDKATYNRVYKAFLDWFREQYSVAPDETTSDPSRPCFLSYDPDLLLNEHPQQVSVSDCLQSWESKYGQKNLPVPTTDLLRQNTLPAPSHPVATNVDLASLSAAVDFLIGKNNEIGGIYDAYNPWQTLGLCCAAIGEQGREPFIRLSLGNTKFHETEADMHREFDKLMKFYGKSPNPVRINTLYHIAKSHGWEMPRRAIENASPGPIFDGSDVDNAEIFVQHHLKEIRALHNFGTDDKHNTFFRWLLWDGRRWRTDGKGEIFHLGRKSIKKLKKDALDCNDRKRADRMDDVAKGLKRLQKQRAMLYEASTDVRVTLENNEVDRDPYLFNVSNGTMDLSNHVVGIRDHDRDDNITKLANVQYDMYASCPQWLTFLDKICGADKDLVSFLQRAVGLSLTGDTSQQTVFFVYGPGGNGKSVFFKVLMCIFGNYAQKAPASMLTQQRYVPIPHDVARLQGRRFVVASELDESMVFDEARLKDLTGGDVLVARLLRQEFFEFEPTHKLWMYGNHKPTVKGSDEGIWRRIKVIPFTAFISPEERIPMSKLVATLKAEASGILNWALKGLMDYKKNGLGSPKVVQEATEAYKTDSDAIGRFIEDCCLSGPSFTCFAKDLYQRYMKWVQENGEPVLSQKKLHARLRELGYVSDTGAGNRTSWKGLGIKAVDLQEVPVELVL
ncbi:MAG: phage/plasmid primase, P4 family [Syntrophales bacterium]